MDEKFVPVPYEMFVELVKAKTERDLLLGAAQSKWEYGYNFEHVLDAILKMNGMEAPVDA